MRFYSLTWVHKIRFPEGEVFSNPKKDFPKKKFRSPFDFPS